MGRSGLWLGALALTGGAASAASPVTGVWRAPVNEALIEVYDCGADVCGRVLDSARLHAHPNMLDVHNPEPADRDKLVKGMVMMKGFNGGPTEWKGGALYNPDDGHTYQGSITLLDASTLKLNGCIIFPLCRSQVWRRER